MSIWVALEASGCLLLLPFRRKMGFLAYQVAVAGVYLLALSMVQELDYTMSVYFAFAVFPYLRFARVPGAVPLLLVIYLLFESAVSVAMNGLFAVASGLVIHYLGPLLLVYVFANVPEGELARGGSPGGQTRYVRHALILAAVLETAVGAVAMSLSDDGRLMLNYQCVSGCIACISMLLCVLTARRGEAAFSVCMAVYLLAWALLSGTRGYIVLAAVMAFLVFARLPGARWKALLFCLAALVGCAVLFVSPESVQGIVSDNRFTESTGRRVYENRWFANMFLSQNPILDAIGFGIGSTYGEQAGAAAAFAGTGIDGYSYRTVLAGHSLHNFWYTMILSIGVVGAVLYVAVLGVFLARRKGVLGKADYACLVAFFLAYAFVLWYRWTATGGILESAVVAVFLAFAKSSRSDNYPHNRERIKRMVEL